MNGVRGLDYATQGASGVGWGFYVAEKMNRGGEVHAASVVKGPADVLDGGDGHPRGAASREVGGQLMFHTNLQGMAR